MKTVYTVWHDLYEYNHYRKDVELKTTLIAIFENKTDAEFYIKNKKYSSDYKIDECCEYYESSYNKENK